MTILIMYLLTSRQSRLLDDLSIKRDRVSSRLLMENAGKAVFKVLSRKYRPHRKAPVIIFCGPGNNGGDGLVVARNLSAQRIPVQIITSAHFTKFLKQNTKPQIIVDALFGTGLSRPPRGIYRRMIGWINAQRAPTISVDIPSGLSADTGKPMGKAVVAQITVTFGFPKIGFFSGKSREYVGELHVASIGFSGKSIMSLSRGVSTHLICRENVKECLSPRKSNIHKGDMGRVYTIACSKGLIGAGIMAADGALRAGAGLSTLILPEAAFDKIDPSRLEIMYKPLPDRGLGIISRSHLQTILSTIESATVVALGPGLGKAPQTIEFIWEFVRKYKGPLVIDADGLNAVALKPSVLKGRQGLTLLTPHSGEMSRLAGVSLNFLDSHRLDVASNFSKKYGVVVLLKGYRSLVALPDGHVWINPTGGPAMAQAGQGDLLTGIYAGLLAQFHIPSPFGERVGVRGRAPLLFGCFLHGLVGDLLAKKGQRVVMAGDIAKNLSLGYSFLSRKSDILNTVFY